MDRMNYVQLLTTYCVLISLRIESNGGPLEDGIGLQIT